MSSMTMTAESGGLTVLAPDSITASGLGSEKLSLPSLQSKMKVDPEGYVTELNNLYRQFHSALEVYKENAALNFNSLNGIGDGHSEAKKLGDIASFLAHMTPFYPKHLSLFPQQLADFLRSSARTLPSSLRCQVAQSLILLINRKMVPIEDTLSLFMELQTLGDKNLKKLAFSQVVHSIRRMNQKHKDETKNRALQRILFNMLQQDDESIAKRSLIVVCDLHRRRVWFDERTANAICMACFHPSSKIMVAALSFLLDYEKIEDSDDSDDSSSEDEAITHKAQVVLNKESVYKAHHKGTSSSKKKKQAKLRRVMRSMKKKQRTDSEKGNSNYYSPLNHLKDSQGFAEKLFSRLQSCNERFEVKMILLKVTARTIGLHRLTLLNFYSYLQKYVQPHQRDITNLLAAAVQACHDMVPPDAVEPLFKQIVNQFVHDRSRPEAIAVGLNVVREICLRIPLLMTEELLQDLVLYRKSNEKAVTSAARSLMTLFREICPSLLVKKDRGRPINPNAKPKPFGERNVASDVLGIEYLLEDDADNSDDDIDDGDTHGPGSKSEEHDGVENDPYVDHSDESDADDGSHIEEDESEADGNGEGEEGSSDSGEENDDNASDVSDNEEDEMNESGDDDEGVRAKSSSKKRKTRDFDMTFDAADKSLRALKRLAANKIEQTTSDGILSNEEFARIKELTAKAEAKNTLAHHGLLKKGADSKTVGFKVPSTDEIHMKRVDPSTLEARFHKKLTKAERTAKAKEGREDTGKYKASTALKQKKKGGLSNRQKEHKKFMPIAAKRSKISRGRIEKKKKNAVAGKQFRGKKAWK